MKLTPEQFKRLREAPARVNLRLIVPPTNYRWLSIGELVSTDDMYWSQAAGGWMLVPSSGFVNELDRTYVRRLS